MRFRVAALVGAMMSLAMAAPAKRVAVLAGSPEDKAIVQITNEKDPARRLPLIDKFAADFASKPDMVTYANQLYQDAYLETREYDKSIEHGEKALAADRQDTDVLLKLVRAAREKPDTARLFRYATQFADLYNGLDSGPRPPDLDEAAWKARNAQMRADLANDYQRSEYDLLEAIARETRPNERLQMLDQFSKSFPKSQPGLVNQYYAYSYQQLGNTAKMMEYAEKTLAGDPDNVAMMLLVAQSQSEQGQNLERATALASKALSLAEKAQPPAGASADWQRSHNASMGLAHSILGFIYMRQNRNPQAISELKAAVPLVRSEPGLLSTTLYRLGFAQAKYPKTLEEARATLTECSSVPGPFQQPARDLLAKINAHLAKP